MEIKKREDIPENRQVRLTVAVELTAPGGRIEPRTAGEWRRRPLPELNKRPAIFIIG